jgi:membrane-bound serine protease (ClpP class)
VGQRLALFVSGLLLGASAMLAGWGSAGSANQPSEGPIEQPQTPKAVAAAARADSIAIITIEGAIDQMTPRIFRRRLEIAERQGVDAVVVELDTPGGEVGAVLEICDMLKGTTIPNTVAWINPAAYSGGAIIALACKEIVVNDPATLGDALVVQFNPLTGINEMSEAERQKFLSPLLVEVVDSARRNGYDEKLVQGVVSLGVELWMIRNKQDPSQILFIDAADYQRIYEREPDRSTSPVLVAASAKIGAKKTLPKVPGTNEADEGDAGDASPDARGAAPGGGANAGDPAFATDPDTAFVPASPKLEDLATTISDNLAVSSKRPEVTAATRSEWTEPVYYANGRGLVTMKAPQLLDAGLARQYVKSDEELKAYFGATAAVRLEPTVSEKLALQLKFLTNPIIKGFLLMVFLTALMIELHAPGLGVPGAIALAALIAFLAPSMLLGLATWWEVVAIVLGMVLLAVELLVLPGFGVFGIAGFVLLLGGIVFTFVDGSGPMGDPEAVSHQLVNGLMATLLAFLSAGVVMFFLSKHLATIPMFNRLVLSQTLKDAPEEGDAMFAAMQPIKEPTVPIGTVGVTTTPLRPVGNAAFGDRVVDVRSDLGYVDAGVEVRVIAAAAFDRLIVEPTESGAA